VRVGAALLAGALLAACGGDDPVDDVDRPTVFGGDRPVELSVPAGFDPEQQYPLVLLLHGYGASGLVQTAYLGLADIPTDPGAFLLAPDGTLDTSGRRFWDSGDACCGDSGVGPVDDIGYLGGLVDDVMAAWPVDPSRVLVIGHSNGHFMAYQLACARADVVTGIAGLAGAANFDPAGCDPSDPVAVLHVHGDADDTVLYEGGVFDAPYPGAVASVTQWAAKNGCDDTFSDGAPRDVDKDTAGAETTVRLADGCPAPADVELWTIVGGSHIPDLQRDFGPGLVEWLSDRPRP
jgi:polyhydroxybutyrate depolymerase